VRPVNLSHLTVIVRAASSIDVWFAFEPSLQRPIV
jgi:hypothetical protein